MWLIKELDFRKSDGVVTNVIIKYGNDGIDILKSNEEVIIKLNEPEGEIIPYEDLTQDIIVNWINTYHIDVVNKLQDGLDNENDHETGTPWEKPFVSLQ